MTARRRFLFALMAANAAAGFCLALTHREDPTPTNGAVVPFEMLASNHMVVQAKINGKGPYNLIFDLGAPVTLLSNKAGEASGVVKGDAPRSFLFSMRGEAKVDKLQVGDLTAEGVPVIVLDHPTIKALGSALRRPLDGIIGYTFFAHYKTTIDYQAHRMTFEPVQFEVRDLMKDLPDRLVGPKVAQQRVLAPGGLWGLSVGAPADDPSSPGVPVRSVLAGSSADAAGLKPGDILTAIDGRWTASVADTYAAAAATPAGHRVPVAIVRDGTELTLMVTPSEGL
jgi:hypothetical protein